jgi:hypothetical protein
MAPRFLIDENLSPTLASHLANTRGFDTVHGQYRGLARCIRPRVSGLRHRP